MNKPCKFDGCSGIVRIKEYCNGHDLQIRRGQELHPLSRPALNNVCEYDGCDKPKKAKKNGINICQGHLVMLKRNGELRPLREVNFRSGRRTAGMGYIEVFIPDCPHSKADGYILEHRYVMEQMLGRKLEKHENVHHKNGIKDDNRPENLELWCVPQPTGQRPEDLVEWVLTKYRELVQQQLSN